MEQNDREKFRQFIRHEYFELLMGMVNKKINEWNTAKEVKGTQWNTLKSVLMNDGKVKGVQELINDIKKVSDY